MQFERMGDKLAENLLNCYRGTARSGSSPVSSSRSVSGTSASIPRGFWPAPSAASSTLQAGKEELLSIREIAHKWPVASRPSSNPKKIEVIERMAAGVASPNGRKAGRRQVYRQDLRLHRNTHPLFAGRGETAGGAGRGRTGRLGLEKTDFVVAGAEAGSKLDKACSWV